MMHHRHRLSHRHTDTWSAYFPRNWSMKIESVWCIHMFVPVRKKCCQPGRSVVAWGMSGISLWSCMHKVKVVVIIKSKIWDRVARYCSCAFEISHFADCVVSLHHAVVNLHSHDCGFKWCIFACIPPLITVCQPVCRLVVCLCALILMKKNEAGHTWSEWSGIPIK